jgi:drug/metabolite transporter (DMT)-like permease
MYNLSIVQTANPVEINRSGHYQRIKADLLLVLVSMIWGSAFVAQRIAADQVGTFLFNGLRFLLAVVVLVPVAWLNFRGDPVNWRMDRRAFIGVGLAGLLLLLGAAFQQAGLRYTTAGNAGFITGLYVVFIPLILAIVWRQPPRLNTWLAAGLAMVGLFLLSTGGHMQLNPGDVLEMIGALFWALHVILIGILVQRLNVWQVSIGQYLICGLLSLFIGLGTEWNTISQLPASWWAIAYTGIVSVGVGYTLQVAAQRYAPPADAAIILSSEAVFAAVSGWLLLNERLTAIQFLGCVIMMAGILLSQAHLFARKKP